MYICNTRINATDTIITCLEDATQLTHAPVVGELHGAREEALQDLLSCVCGVGEEERGLRYRCLFIYLPPHRKYTRALTCACNATVASTIRSQASSTLAPKPLRWPPRMEP